MTPVRHDSPDYIELNKTVATLVQSVESLQDTQTEHHRENQARFERIENDMNALTNRVSSIERLIARMEGLLEGLTTAAKALRWTIGVAAAIVSLLLGINTLFGPAIRKHMGLPVAHTPATVGENNRPAPFDATLPTQYQPR